MWLFVAAATVTSDEDNGDNSAPTTPTKPDRSLSREELEVTEQQHFIQ